MRRLCLPLSSALDGNRMNTEIISRVELLNSNELLLGLESSGQPKYQHVYREAAGVYWDAVRFGFKSTPIQKWSCAQWYLHILSVVQTGLGVKLHLGQNVTWCNIPEKDQQEIENAI